MVEGREEKEEHRKQWRIFSGEGGLSRATSLAGVLNMSISSRACLKIYRAAMRADVGVNGVAVMRQTMANEK